MPLPLNPCIVSPALESFKSEFRESGKPPYAFLQHLGLAPEAEADREDWCICISLQLSKADTVKLQHPHSTFTAVTHIPQKACVSFVGPVKRVVKSV